MSKPFIVYDEVADVPENVLELYRSRLTIPQKAKYVFKEWKKIICSTATA